MMASTANRAYSRLSGVVFGMFKKRKEILTPHWLDTNMDKYLKSLEEIVIPDAMELAPDAPMYQDRLKKLLTHTNPALNPVWNFWTELMYRTVADEAHQTEENITKAYLLRGVMDLMCTNSLVLDDCSDNSDYRRGKKAWHTICSGGLSAAIWDGTLLGLIPAYILKKHFRKDPGYVQMFEVVTTANTHMTLGQSLDVINQRSEPSMDRYLTTIKYKTVEYLNAGAALGILHAGVLSEDILRKTMDAYAVMAKIFQIWDDFTDYACTPEQAGKPACDLANGGNTWLSAIALQHFTTPQAKEFKSCYGSSDPAKMKRVRELYDEIDMPSKYVNCQRDLYKYTEQLIQTIPHPRIQEGSRSYLEWLVGQDCLQ